LEAFLKERRGKIKIRETAKELPGLQRKEVHSRCSEMNST